jgi:hypothetical protein
MAVAVRSKCKYSMALDFHTARFSKLHVEGVMPACTLTENCKYRESSAFDHKFSDAAAWRQVVVQTGFSTNLTPF